MKKIVSFLLCFVILFTLVPITFADGEPEKVDVTIDGRKVKVNKVNLLFNDKPVESDVPPIIYEDRTLVPVRFVANYLNADIEWDGDKYQVIITLPQKEIILTINSSEVLINGEVNKLPYGVPAKLVNDRTMVPLRFVSEALGCRVEWDSKTWTGLIYTKEQETINVLDVLVEKDDVRLPKIIIETTGDVAYDKILLEEPHRLVIDINNSKFSVKNNSLLDAKGILDIDVDTYPIKEIRASQFSVDPDVTRVVIELTDNVEYNIKALDTKDGLQISFINKVQKIQLEEFKGRQCIAIYNTSNPNYNVFRLSNPDRFVFDILDSQLENEKATYNFKTDFIKGVRLSQFSPDSLYKKNDKIVRVVIDVEENNQKPGLVIRKTDEKVMLFVDNQNIKGIGYVRNEDTGGVIEIDARKRTKFGVTYDQEENIMEISVLERNVNVEDGTYIINDDFINSISVEDDKEKNDHKRILVKFNTNINFNVDSTARNYDFKINFAKQNINNKYSDKVIVIDAGHGGEDPGAIAPNLKYKEKDINLNVALKLEAKLKEAGFKTLLIRNRDEYIDKYERAAIANESDGDVFISIHFNAHSNSNIAGIETFYCPAYESSVKTGDNFPFADAIHQELIKGLGSIDRGIKRNSDLVVVRETKMVAVLVELGFMTNPVEEQKIITSEYQDKAAEALLRGIIRYFDEMDSQK